MISKNSWLGFLAFLVGVVLFGLGVLKVNKTQMEVLSAVGKLEDRVSILQKSLDDTKIEKALLEVDLAKVTERLGVLEESIDPKNFRWAKIKKVREAVQKTHKEEGFAMHMSTTELTKYASAVVDYSEQYDVPIALILAMTRQESFFNPRALSRAGAIGSLQVMPTTASEIAGELNVRRYSMYNVHDNVRFSVYYTMKLLDEFNEDIELVVRAYNCGPHYVEKVEAGEYSGYPKETDGYVEKILGPDRESGYLKYYENMGL